MRSSVFMLLLTLSLPAWSAKSIKDEAGTRLVADAMLAVTKDGLKPALDVAKPYWPLDASEIDGAASQYSALWTVVNERFGTPMGTDFLRTERIGDRLVRYIYLQRFQKHAMVWEVTFYRPGAEWYFNSFKFVDDLDPYFVTAETR